MFHKKDNKGFTLIEVLLSIVIFMILLLPLLSNFTHAAKINLKAKKIQKATIVGGNLMEALSFYPLEDIALEFNDKKELKFLADDLSRNGYEIPSYSEDGYGEYAKIGESLFKLDEYTAPYSSVALVDGKYIFSPPGGRKEFVYGISSLKAKDFAYDSVITISSEAYKDNRNAFDNPNLMELDMEAISIIDPYGSNMVWSDDSETAVIVKNNNEQDEQAISQLRDKHLAYLAYVERQVDESGNPLPRPTEYSESQIRNHTRKELVIALERENDSIIKVKAIIKYYCDLDLNNDSVTEELESDIVMEGTYPLDIASGNKHTGYIFYTPSSTIDDEKIVIKNKGVNAMMYLVNQQEGMTKKVQIRRENTGGGITVCHTNLDSSQMDTDASIEGNLLYETSKRDWVYQISVSLYPEGSIDKGDLSNPYITLYSTREE